MIQSPYFWCMLLLTWCVSSWLGQRFRLRVMAAASLGYITWIAPESSLMLLVWIILGTVLTRLPEKFRLRFSAAIIMAALAMLGYFKYIPGIMASAGTSESLKIIIPLGISFYTFKLIHFCVEVARGTIKGASFTNILLYFYWFPIFTAGPIERFDHFLENCEYEDRSADILAGLNRIVYGIIKKFVICEMLLRSLQGSLTADNLFNYLDDTSTPRLWVFLGTFYLLTYLDFSAYSDIAIGASRLFGLRIMENFNFPIVATNIGDFWRRWHMTLSKWCQAYVYMPVLGSTRRPFVACYCSFIVFGLWHAGTVTRLSWGIYHATGVVVFLIWNRYKRNHRLSWPNSQIWRFPSYAMTQAFVIAGMATLVGEEAQVSFWDSLRLMARLFVPS